MLFFLSHIGMKHSKLLFYWQIDFLLLFSKAFLFWKNCFMLNLTTLVPRCLIVSAIQILDLIFLTNLTIIPNLILSWVIVWTTKAISVWITTACCLSLVMWCLTRLYFLLQSLNLLQLLLRNILQYLFVYLLNMFFLVPWWTLKSIYFISVNIIILHLKCY